MLMLTHVVTILFVIPMKVNVNAVTESASAIMISNTAAAAAASGLAFSILRFVLVDVLICLLHQASKLERRFSVLVVVVT